MNGISLYNAKEQVTDALRHHGSLHLSDLCKFTGLATANVREALESLIQDGIAEPDHPDKYRDQYKLAKKQTSVVTKNGVEPLDNPDYEFILSYPAGEQRYWLDRMTADQLRVLRQREATWKNRKTVLDAIDRRIRNLEPEPAAEPQVSGPDYEQNHEDDDPVPSYQIGLNTYHLVYHDLLPPLSPEEYEALKADIQEHGIKIPVFIAPIPGQPYHYEVIDGGHRTQIAAELGLPQILTKYEHNLDSATRRTLAENLNLHRRHLSPDQRQQWVARLRAQGQSLRTIANQVGTSAATVRRDLEAATTAGVSYETPVVPQFVVGADGKKYPTVASTKRERTITTANFGTFTITTWQARGDWRCQITAENYDYTTGGYPSGESPRAARRAALARYRRSRNLLATTAELAVTFNRDAITLQGRTDNGAWDRAIDVARALCAAGAWDGEALIFFNAYHLHNKLFGANPVDVSGLYGSDYTTYYSQREWRNKRGTLSVEVTQHSKTGDKAWSARIGFSYNKGGQLLPSSYGPTRRAAYRAAREYVAGRLPTEFVVAYDADEAIRLIQSETIPERLASLHRHETNGRARKTVLAAIEAQINAAPDEPAPRDNRELSALANHNSLLNALAIMLDQVDGSLEALGSLQPDQQLDRAITQRTHQVIAQLTTLAERLSAFTSIDTEDLA